MEAATVIVPSGRAWMFRLTEGAAVMVIVCVAKVTLAVSFVSAALEEVTGANADAAISVTKKATAKIAVTRKAIWRPSQLLLSCTPPPSGPY